MRGALEKQCGTDDNARHHTERERRRAEQRPASCHGNPHRHLPALAQASASTPQLTLHSMYAIQPETSCQCMRSTLHVCLLCQCNIHVSSLPIGVRVLAHHRRVSPPPNINTLTYQALFARGSNLPASEGSALLAPRFGSVLASVCVHKLQSASE